jgi:hypothetical protein
VQRSTPITTPRSIVSVDQQERANSEQGLSTSPSPRAADSADNVDDSSDAQAQRGLSRSPVCWSLPRDWPEATIIGLVAALLRLSTADGTHNFSYSTPHREVDPRLLPCRSLLAYGRDNLLQGCQAGAPTPHHLRISRRSARSSPPRQPCLAFWAW